MKGSERVHMNEGGMVRRIFFRSLEGWVVFCLVSWKDNPLAAGRVLLCSRKCEGGRITIYRAIIEILLI